MFIDSSIIEEGKTINAELCIIGAGVAGITVAREFINKKADVLLLESGGFEPDAEIQSLNEGKNVGLSYYDLDQTRTRAFGGTSHRWIIDINKDSLGVRLRGMDKIDFEKRDWVPYSGWPISKEQLDPYYERAHKICKIGPYTYDVNKWIDPEHTPPLPFVNGNVKTTIFQFARKDVFFNDYRNELNEAENITTLLNATVLKINTEDNAKQVQQVLVTSQTGKRFSVKAKYFILAMGALEIPRLLLLSNDVMKCGLGNQNDLVGRFFMEHPHLWSGVYYPSNTKIFDRTDLYKIQDRNGVPIMGKLTIDEHVLRKEKLLNFTTSIHPTRINTPKKGVEALKTIGSAARRGKIADNLQEHFKNCIYDFDSIAYAGLRRIAGKSLDNWVSSKHKLYGFKLNIMAEQIPDPESRVQLDTARDRFGQNKIKLNWKLNSLDIRSIRRAQEIIDKELHLADLGRLEIELEGDSPPPDIHGGWHHMGTTRMHEDPKQGVLNENCKVHGIQNLFIAGSSVFPTVGYANPVLTSVALSVRLADHLKKHLSN